MIKTLILVVIVSVIPLFFLVVFAGGAVSRLSARRARGLGALAQLHEALTAYSSALVKLAEASRIEGAGDARGLQDLIVAGRALEAASRRTMAAPDESVPVLELSRVGAALAATMAKWRAAPDARSEAATPDLVRQVHDAGQELAAARERYHEAVTAYHAARRAFPGRCFVGVGRFREMAIYPTTPSDMP